MQPITLENVMRPGQGIGMVGNTSAKDHGMADLVALGLSLGYARAGLILDAMVICTCRSLRKRWHVLGLSGRVDCDQELFA